MTDKPARKTTPLIPSNDPLAAALKILGVKKENVITSRAKENGGVVVIINQGQKFTFSADELKNPRAARARLRREGLRVLPPLDPKKLAFQPKPDDGLPHDD